MVTLALLTEGKTRFLKIKTMKNTLLQKIHDKTAHVGVIGLGYVGLPLAVEFAKAGYKVTGIDINEDRIAELNRGENYIQDIDDQELADLVANKMLQGSTDFSVVKELDAISISVPTPLNKQKDPDISYIVSVMDAILSFLHEGMLIVLESTTYPGTTTEHILPKIESLGYDVGKDIFLCFSPERIDPGNPTWHVGNTPKVIGGVSPDCSIIGKAHYESIIKDVVPVSSPEAAELVKLLENTFRSINIGLANEMAIMCEKLGVDVWEVIEAAATKPFGFMKFTPGPGLGGHCIPIDPHYLSWKMKTLDYKARFIELAGEINTSMPEHVVQLITKALNTNQKAVNGSSVLVLGIAYKKNIDDVRESPALDVMRLLEREGASVDYFDPYVDQIVWDGDFFNGVSDLNSELLKKYDVVTIITDHDSVDYDFIKKYARLIVDTRNVYSGNKEAHIIRLGT